MSQPSLSQPNKSPVQVKAEISTGRDVNVSESNK